MNRKLTSLYEKVLEKKSNAAAPHMFSKYGIGAILNEIYMDPTPESSHDDEIKKNFQNVSLGLGKQVSIRINDRDFIGTIVAIKNDKTQCRVRIESPDREPFYHTVAPEEIFPLDR